MSKHICLVMVLLILIAGCRSERAGRATPAPEKYLTALEAYERIRPAMLAWHGDAIVIGMGSLSGAPPEWRIDASGKAPWWNFSIHSPDTLKITEINWMSGEIIVGVDQIPGKEFSAPSAVEGLPIDTMIDSDEAVKIAMENDVDPDWILLQINIDFYDSATDRYLPPSWGLTFASPEDMSQERRVIIDAVTGEVLRNDFAGP